MALDPQPLRFYGAPSDATPLDWEEVAAQLGSAGTYWVVAGSGDLHPHPRPVWGVWSPVGDDALWLSIGSPSLRAQVTHNPKVTAHLDSGVEVVIVEGLAEVVDVNVDAALDAVAALVAAYDRKYDWSYTVEEYGPPTRICPTSVIAWRSAGWAGRDGFSSSGKWRTR